MLDAQVLLYLIELSFMEVVSAGEIFTIAQFA